VTALWVAFEGGEGSGKSTQAARFASRFDALLTREPGGTPEGRRIRELLLDPDASIGERAEALLMAADRALHVETVVEPALAGGRMVVSDRSAFSSLAYQGFGRGLPFEEVRSLSDWASRGRWPDVVVLLDVPDDVRAGRMQRAHDRLEAAGRDFHDRVNGGFREMAAADPDRWLTIDGAGSVDDVESSVVDAYERWVTARH
jgi:dTMP kinase